MKKGIINFYILVTILICSINATNYISNIDNINIVSPFRDKPAPGEEVKS